VHRGAARRPHLCARRLRDEHLPGATVHESVVGLAGSVHVLVTSLATLAASRDVLIEQAAPAAAEGAVLVDTSTVTQQLSLDCAGACSRRGLHFIDAPVSGGPAKAADETLSVIAGGSIEAMQMAQGVPGCMGTVFHVGTGTAAKLVNQLLVGVHSAAACEALLLAKRLGIEARARRCAQAAQLQACKDCMFVRSMVTYS
jgi:L-threonate 2-dehydrogenase